MALKHLITVSLGILGSFTFHAQQKAEVHIQKEVNGKVEEITQEIEIQHGQDIATILDSLNLLDEVGDISSGQKFEIILWKSDTTDNPLEHNLLFTPPSLTNKLNQGFLGVVLRDIISDEFSCNPCVQITEVIEDSPAQLAGIIPNDIILAVDDVPAINTASVIQLISAHQPGDAVSLRILRDNDEIEIDATLDAKAFNHNEAAVLSLQFPHSQHFNQGFDILFNESRAYLGITKGEDLADGVQVGKVLEASPAEEMGIKAGDVIIEVNKTPVSSFDELADIIGTMSPGDEIELTIIRDQQKMQLTGSAGQNPNILNELDFKKFNGCDENGSYLFEFEMPDFEDQIYELRNDSINQFFNENIEELLDIIEDSDQEAQRLFENGFNDAFDNSKVLIEILPLNQQELEDVTNHLKIENPEELEVGTIELYPNPTNDKLRLSMLLPSTGLVQLTILNSQGSKIHEEEFDHAGGRIVRSIDLSEESGGIYYLVISQQDRLFTKKIIKK